MKTQHMLIYIGIATLNAVLAALGTQLMLGSVPIPTWIIPIAVAGITSLTMLLPKLADAELNGVITTTTVTTSPAAAPQPTVTIEVPAPIPAVPTPPQSRENDIEIATH